MKPHRRRCAARDSVRRHWRSNSFALSLAVALQLMPASRSRGENQVDYRYEDYFEDDDRIQVQTHAALFDAALKEGLVSIKGEVVHDAVSGATPNGAAPPAKYNFDNTFGGITGNTNDTSVPLSHMEDTRRAVSLEVPVTFSVHEFVPQFSYSEESDYISYGAALNYSVQLNEKNTTLTFGSAHAWDRVRDASLVNWQDKTSHDFLVGVNQLLGPKTVLGVNFTYGFANGYLDDPYRSIVGHDPVFIFSGPSDFIGTTEHRPDYRDKFIARISLTQFITPANASVEGAYRYYRDSFGIDAHTIELTWFQKIGKYVVISPNVRYYYQTAADFYLEMLPGVVTDPTTNPKYYSADYRLSEFQSFTAGINVTIKAAEWLMFDAGYKRYIMEGLDGVTSQTAYPSANVFTVGARIFF